jgi:hypothetical protein
MGFVSGAMSGMPQMPQQPGQPQVPVQGGKGGVQQPTIPAQGGKGNMPLPEGYQSPYANYGFDPGLQSYLDQQNYRSTFDAGVGYQYDPTNQTFTGGTMSGRYNPIPLSVMQQVAGGNRDVLSPYFQSKYPQQPISMPKNAIVELPRDPVTNRFYNPNDRQTQPQVMPQVQPMRPQMPQRPQVQPANPQRGLGGLQTDKFRRRLG